VRRVAERVRREAGAPGERAEVVQVARDRLLEAFDPGDRIALARIVRAGERQAPRAGAARARPLA